MENWICFTCEPGEPAWNMAADQALLTQSASFGVPVLRFYEWAKPAATFGYFQRHTEVEKMTALRPLVRRTTGGGVVPHERDWTYSLTIPPNHDWFRLKAEASYRRMHAWLRDSLIPLGLNSELADCCNPVSPGQCFVGAEKHDLVHQGGKIAGAAQRRTKQGLMIQGSLQLRNSNIERRGWEKSMIAIAGEAWGISFQSRALSKDAVLMTTIRELAEQKFSTDAHNRRR